MRNVILVAHTTVDGFLSGSNGELDWMTHDPQMDADLWYEQRDAVDLMLVGRKAHHGFEAHFGAHVADPNSPAELVEFSRWMLDTPKVVFLRTLAAAALSPSARLAEADDIPTEVASLKVQQGKDMVIFGGVSTVRQFIQHGLIDEYIFKIHPAAIGAGQSAFADLRGKVNLEMVESRAYDSGVNVLRYRPA